MKGFEIVSLRFVVGFHLWVVSSSVHREGVNPNSMDSVRDLDHIDLNDKFIFWSEATRQCSGLRWSG